MIASRPSTSATALARASIGSSSTDLPSAVAPASRKAASVCASASDDSRSLSSRTVSIVSGSSGMRGAIMVSPLTRAHRGLDPGGGVLDREQHVVGHVLGRRDPRAAIAPGAASATESACSTRRTTV